ncbi:ABC transporter ATP-binding protein [Crossiella sp. SN42]|uniref:ABC transporter ATP-binding protein n=1 Tax=Crossiella sp. SN42 TaxID=2944808 RepID=UPI00207C1F0D|nr:ABC transporter ATP-binding protein [Crossiella sp. SN42]MCO1574606.1 ABC transporter ATP-binding protein [Crossiella sp. SN42]
MTTNTAVLVRDLRKTYRGNLAVDGVGLDIAHGEIFALLGPNGAGKTSVVEILNGHRRRDSGTVQVLGADPGSAGPAWRARVGIVSQEELAFPELPVVDLLRHFAGYYPRPRDPDQLVEAVGLTEKRTARVQQLSGGQRRRLDVALGIVGGPDLLFLDEPTTGFDAEARRQFWELIKGLAAAGTTILLTTHYLEEAEYLADRIGLMAGGKLVDIGPADRVGRTGQDLARVSWDAPSGAKHVDTDTPTGTVLELAERYGGEVPGLIVRQPTLEDAYLRLIGEQR